MRLSLFMLISHEKLVQNLSPLTLTLHHLISMMLIEIPFVNKALQDPFKI